MDNMRDLEGKLYALFMHAFEDGMHPGEIGHALMIARKRVFYPDDPMPEYKPIDLGADGDAHLAQLKRRYGFK